MALRYLQRNSGSLWRLIYEYGSDWEGQTWSSTQTKRYVHQRVIWQIIPGKIVHGESLQTDNSASLWLIRRAIQIIVLSPYQFALSHAPNWVWYLLRTYFPTPSEACQFSDLLAKLTLSLSGTVADFMRFSLQVWGFLAAKTPENKGKQDPGDKSNGELEDVLIEVCANEANFIALNYRPVCWSQSSSSPEARSQCWLWCPNTACGLLVNKAMVSHQ